MSPADEIASLKAQLEQRRAGDEAVPALLAEVDYARRRIAWLEHERDQMAAELAQGAGLARRLADFARDGGEWKPQTGAGVPDAPPPQGGSLDWRGFRERALAPGRRYRGIWVQESSIDWNHSLYQRPQHMALALARRGWLVVYHTTNASHDRVEGWRELLPNLWLTNDPACDAIEGAVRSVYNTSYGQPLHTLKLRPRGTRIVFEVVDHLDVRILGTEDRVRQQSALQAWAFDEGADLVVATARALHEPARAVLGDGRCVLVPNGVDVRHYRNPARLGVPVDPRIAAFRERFGRLVGYFGAIAPWLDVEAIAGLARLRPEIGFVFIGPDYQGAASRFPQADNLLATGPLPYADLPANGRCFDACLIPFEDGEVAHTTSPLKLFEYFALGKPVVVSHNLSEYLGFDGVFAGTGAQGLSEAIDQALVAATQPGFAARMAAQADANSWDERARVLEDALARTPPRRQRA